MSVLRFGIVGAGNVHLFEAIAQRGFTEIVCVHHEQSACMAMQTYFRTHGKLAAALLTTGAGATNGVTGVVSAVGTTHIVLTKTQAEIERLLLSNDADDSDN